MSFVLGIIVGFVSSFLGVGGGIFLVPLLPRVYSLTAYDAIILSIIFIFISVVINSIQYQLQKKIVWSFAFRMAPFIIIGGFFGSNLATHTPGYFLRIFLAIFLMLMSFGFLKTLLSFRNGNVDLKHNFFANLPPYFLGGFSGMLSGFAGVGSGMFLNWLVLNNKNIKSSEESPTVNAMMIFVCLGVFVSSFLFDLNLFEELFRKVGWGPFLLMVFGIIIGSFIGKTLNGRNLHKLRVISLVFITFSLAMTVFYEILFKR